jgi:hypothetical protein
MISISGSVKMTTNDARSTNNARSANDSKAND